MIAFGCVVSSEETYRRHALAGIRQFAEPGTPVVAKRGRDCIFTAYNDILAEVAPQPDLEAVVLLHQDVRISGPEFNDVVRDQLRDRRVAVLGTMGVRDVRSIAWWEGDAALGRVEWEWFGDDPVPAGPHRTRLMEGDAPSGECDAVDGLIMVLSSWAARELRFDESLGPGFHGYDVDICFQVRAAGRKVAVAPLPVVHCTRGEWHGWDDWVRVHQAFARKWGL